MKIFILTLFAFAAAPAFAANLLYPVGAYRGQCDSLFLEHVYKDSEKVGIRDVRQNLAVELAVTDHFGTQTLQFKQTLIENGKAHVQEFTKRVNQTGQGTWREIGGSDEDEWAIDWRQSEDGTVRSETNLDDNYTSEHWLLVTERRIYLYEHSERKPGKPRNFKNGHENISSRQICTFDKQ